MIRRGNKNPKKKNSKSYSKIPVRCLLDSGCSATIGRKNIEDQISSNTENHRWHTAAGKFTTVGKSKIQLQLTELSQTAILEETIFVTDQDLGQYDIIIGRNTLENLGIDLLFSTSTINWPDRDVELPMKPMRGNSRTEHFYISDPPGLQHDSLVY